MAFTTMAQIWSALLTRAAKFVALNRSTDPNGGSLGSGRSCQRIREYQSLTEDLVNHDRRMRANSIVVFSAESAKVDQFVACANELPFYVYVFSDIRDIYQWVEMKAQSIACVVIDASLASAYETAVLVSIIKEEFPWIGTVSTRVGGTFDESQRAGVKFDICLGGNSSAEIQVGVLDAIDIAAASTRRRNVSAK